VLIVVHSSEDSELILIEPEKKVCRIGNSRFGVTQGGWRRVLTGTKEEGQPPPLSVLFQTYIGNEVDSQMAGLVQPGVKQVCDLIGRAAGLCVGRKGGRAEAGRRVVKSKEAQAEQGENEKSGRASGEFRRMERREWWLWERRLR